MKNSQMPICSRFAKAERLAKEFGFSLTRAYRRNAFKGYYLANHNELDEFRQPKIQLCENLSAVSSKINEYLLAVKR